VHSVKNSAKTCKVPRVALLIETSRSYGRDLLVGIAQYVRSHGPWSIEFQEGDTTERSPDWFKNWDGDGIIARVKTHEVAKTVLKKNLPTIDLYCELSHLQMATLRSDETLVGRLAAQHLLERGFQHFAFSGFNSVEWSNRRGNGFRQSIAEAGFSCQTFENPRPTCSMTSIEFEEHGLKYENQLAYWIAGLPKPIGIMACNDVRARQILKACRDLDMAVPDEVAVVGVDKDEVLCELSDQPISSIILNTKRIGFEAAALLDQMMKGAKCPKETVLVEPLGIATRRSTDTLAVEDSNLAKALLFIRDHACEQISVDTVATFAGLSRSVLQRKFRAAFQKTVHDAIVGSRLKRACELLTRTDIPLIDVAEKSGFKHCEYMAAVFKSHFRRSPSQFRSQTSPGIKTQSAIELSIKKLL
jgi:LacI family transcriptional regulator, galactose operon repressor